MEEIIIAFNAGNYNESILKLKAFILKEDVNPDAFALLGKCYYQLALQDQDTAATHYLKAFDYFSKTIEVCPDFVEARLYRAYLAVYNLVPNQLETAYHDAEIIVEIGNLESKIKGYDYQYLASYNMGKSDLALASLPKVKPLIEEFYKNDQPERCKELALLEWKTADVFYNLKKDESHGYDFYERGFEYYPNNNNFNKFLFTLAIKNKKYETLAKVANVIIDLSNVENDSEFLPEMTVDLKAIIDSGVEEVSIFKAYVRLLHNDPYFDEIELFTLINDCTNQFPTDYYFPGIMGNIMYFKNNYKEALPYFKKALELGFDARIRAKLFICNYKVNKKFEVEAIPNVFVNPISSHSAGIDLDQFKNEFKQGSEKFNVICEVQKQFYENAHNEFCYFYSYNKGNPLSNHTHYFAMNCNNYGIVLGELGRYEESISIFETGYQLSPFWEQLNSLSNAQYVSGKYSDCIVTINKMFSECMNQISLGYYVYYRRILIDCYSNTNQELLAIKEIEAVENEIKSIEDDMIRQHDKNKIRIDLDSILNKKALLIEKSHGMQESILVLEKRLEENPDNESVYYLLFQQYHKEEQYVEAVGCADNYFQLAKKMDNEELLTYLYRRGASLRHLNRLEESISDLEKAVMLDDDNYWSKHELALAYFQNNEIEKFKPLAHWCINEHVCKNFDWENDVNEIAFYLIEIYKLENNKKEIMNLVKIVLKKDPDNKEAKLLKKEYSGWFGF